MRWTRLCILGCVLTSGCHFAVGGVAPGGSDASGGNGDDGGVTDCSDCQASCSPLPAPHCQPLAPTGPVSGADFDLRGLQVITIATDTIIDTETGAIVGGGVNRAAGTAVVAGIGFRVATQASGPQVGVFSVAGLTVQAGAHVTFRGVNAFAMAAAGAVTIAGVLDGSCGAGGPGPGGSLGGTDKSPGGAGQGGGSGGASGNGGGGGGGSYGDSGGKGAPGPLGTPAAGGSPFGDLTASSFVLVGGSGGGAGGGSGAAVGAGGGGGGALMLAVDGDLVIADGIITVGGCGGGSGAQSKAGGGGGAGGAIVLEARNLRTTAGAHLAANGGGGGAGDSGGAGQGGGSDVTPAAGGLPGPPDSAGGGGAPGGARSIQAGAHFTQGADAVLAPTLKYGGGGGGGTGRIAVQTQTNGLDDQSLHVSPDGSDRNTENQKMTTYATASFAAE